jgi:uncharacterized protein
MIQPQRIGKFLETDAAGYIRPDVSRALIGGKWEPLVDLTAHALMGTGTVRAVYVRGSVPRGLALEDVSDLDVIYISESEQAEAERGIQEQAREKFPFVPKIEFLRLTDETFNRIVPPRRTPYFHMLLKTQSLFMAGSDVTRFITPFRPGPEMVSHAFGLPKTYAETLQRLHDDPPADETEIRQWFSRRLVRAGFEITLNRQLRFTRDLYLCWEQFAEFYPDYKTRMYEALVNSLNGHESLAGYGDLVALIRSESPGILS